MKRKSIDNCTSTSCSNLPSAKSPRKNRIEISDTTAEDKPKETMIEPKILFMGPMITRISEQIKVPLTYVEQILNKSKNIIPRIVQKRKMRRSRRNYTIWKKHLQSDTNVDVTNQVFIMCDSIVKHIRVYELSQRVENCKCFVKSFSGAKVRCMENYIQPKLRETPSHVILHVRTNDVTTKQDPQQIAKSIINLAVKIKRNCDVSISSITARNDKYLRKVAHVNKYLKDNRREKKLHFIKHGNAIKVGHLNASKLHLNKKGTQVLSNQFAEAISNIIN